MKGIDWDGADKRIAWIGIIFALIHVVILLVGVVTWLFGCR